MNISGATNYDASIPLDKRTEAFYNKDDILEGVRLADENGNPLPADASISAEAIDADDDCKVTFPKAGAYGNAKEPQKFEVYLEGCTKGKIQFKAVVSGITSIYSPYVNKNPTP